MACWGFLNLGSIREDARVKTTIQLPKKPITLVQTAQLFADAINPEDQDAAKAILNSILFRAHSGAIQGRLPLTREPLSTEGIVVADYAENLVFTASDIRELAKIYDIEVMVAEEHEKTTPVTPAPGFESPAPAVPVAAESWHLKEPERERGYNYELYRILKAAHDAGKPCPKARDVLDSWGANRPPNISEVMPDGFKYLDPKGNTKAADLELLRKTIDRMTSAR